MTHNLELSSFILCDEEVNNDDTPISFRFLLPLAIISVNYNYKNISIYR